MGVLFDAYRVSEVRKSECEVSQRRTRFSAGLYVRILSRDVHYAGVHTDFGERFWIRGEGAEVQIEPAQDVDVCIDYARPYLSGGDRTFEGFGGRPQCKRREFVFDHSKIERSGRDYGSAKRYSRRVELEVDDLSNSIVGVTVARSAAWHW